jgi:2-(3-amino-3-carboxypropyl)histidine synthase
MQYNLELDKVVAKIKAEQPKTVCIQLADGLKPKAEKIKATIEKDTNAEVFIWLGSCFGACDLPRVNTDMLISFGHAKWKYDKKFGDTRWE